MRLCLTSLFFEDAILVITMIVLIIEAITIFIMLEENETNFKFNSWFYIILNATIALIVTSYLIIRSQEHGLIFFT